MTLADTFHATSFNLLAALAAVALVLIVGLAAMTRRPPAFVAADRSAGVTTSSFVIAAALISTVPATMLTGAIYRLGSDGLYWIIGAGAGFVLMATLLAPAFRAAEATSAVDFLTKRFNSRALAALGALLIAGCSFVFLALQFVAIGRTAEASLGIPGRDAVMCAVAVTGLVLAAGGARSAKWTSIPLLLGAMAAIVIPLGVWAMSQNGSPIGQLAYGKTLESIASQEIEMISSELADAVSMKPHSRPFLQVDYFNTLALIVCIMAGTAVLPHVLMRTAASADVRTTRTSLAWALLLTAAVLTALPAYAAMAKHEVYSRIAKGVPFAELPREFARDSVAIHGVKFRLLGEVTVAVRSGASDAGGVEAQLLAHRSENADAWTKLAPEVQEALLSQARDSGDRSEADNFETWRNRVLPIAANAAGNTTGKMTQSALSLDPDDAVFTGLALSGLPSHWSFVFALGCLLAALASATAAAWATVQIVPAAGASPIVRITVIAATALAGVVAVYGAETDWMRLAAWAFSILAAGLFPVLVAGVWWRRVSPAAAIAGLLAGALATLGYIGATEFAPERVHQSNIALQKLIAPPSDELATFSDVPGEADTFGGGDAEGSEAVVDGRIFGIDNSAAGVFGLPLGFLAIILVSLVTRGRPAGEHTPMAGKTSSS